MKQMQQIHRHNRYRTKVAMFGRMEAGDAAEDERGCYATQPPLSCKLPNPCWLPQHASHRPDTLVTKLSVASAASSRCADIHPRPAAHTCMLLWHTYRLLCCCRHVCIHNAAALTNATESPAKPQGCTTPAGWGMHPCCLHVQGMTPQLMPHTTLAGLLLPGVSQAWVKTQ